MPIEAGMMMTMSEKPRCGCTDLASRQAGRRLRPSYLTPQKQEPSAPLRRQKGESGGQTP